MRKGVASFSGFACDTVSTVIFTRNISQAYAVVNFLDQIIDPSDYKAGFETDLSVSIVDWNVVRRRLVFEAN